MASSEKAHVSINVSNLGRAVEFYKMFLGVEPAKHYKDYAKFELSDPPLVLSLEPVFHRASDAFNHLGLRLGSSTAVKGVQSRLKENGVVTECEDDVECCYSRQTKFWLADPDRNLWEIYALTAEIPHRGALSSSDALVARDRQGQQAVWEHRLGDPIPDHIPHPEGSLDEVQLKGTFNTPHEESARKQLLTEALRALKPGGHVLTHGLVADRRMPNGFPKLPGPAALVREAPLETEPGAWLREAGFVGTYVQKMPELANMKHEGAHLRELLLFGYRPGSPASEAPLTRIIYRGPFARVTDDAGRTYERGERTAVDAETAARLRLGPGADQFIFLRGTEPKA